MPVVVTETANGEDGLTDREKSWRIFACDQDRQTHRGSHHSTVRYNMTEERIRWSYSPTYPSTEGCLPLMTSMSSTR